MSLPAEVRSKICLNMIVKNEAHIVDELLDSVAPYINYWVIVDTGSDDGTQRLIQDRLSDLGIPGELHERPWVNFGYNRTEAFALAQGHADYIWVMDADNVVVGTLDFSRLVADVYLMRFVLDGPISWHPILFRDGLDVRWVGVTHEYVIWSTSSVSARIEGDYDISDRLLSSRNISGQKFGADRDLLIAEIERNPDDSRSIFYLAQSYARLGDFAEARKWYTRRIEMGGWDEEVYWSMLQAALMMERLGEPWPEILIAYLRAWEFRPTRAEALYEIARHYRLEGRYQLGYLFAQYTAQIPMPNDRFAVARGIHAWRALDEQAVCASWTGRESEALDLNERLLTRTDIPDDDRRRIEGNRDLLVRARKSRIDADVDVDNRAGDQGIVSSS